MSDNDFKKKGITEVIGRRPTRNGDVASVHILTESAPSIYQKEHGN